MKIIDLTRAAGNFESASIVPGRRSVRLWSYTQPQPGDLVVIQRTEFKVAYRIDSASKLEFTGSDHNKFWRAEMQDTEGKFHPDEAALLIAAGLAQA
jgi:hypothetical protein